MPRKDDEENNYFNHFGLAKADKQKQTKMKIPPRPPGKTKAEQEAEAKKKQEALAKNKITPQKEVGETVDGVKAANNDPSKHSNNNKENQNKLNGDDAKTVADAGTGNKRQKDPVQLPPQDTKNKDDKFMSWVTNGKDDDINQCENVLFGN